MSRIRNPIFIIGCGRSGTSILTEVIGSHKDIALFPGEANDLWHPKSYPWRYSDLKKPLMGFNPRRFTQMSLEDWTILDRKRIKAIFGAWQLISHKPFFLNKSAKITFMIPHILDLFPKARFIHIYRDGRAVSLSYAKREYEQMKVDPIPYKKKGYSLPFEKLLEAIAIGWQEHILEIESQKRKLQLCNKGILFELGYEDFCASPQDGLNHVANFLNINPDKFSLNDFSNIKNTNYKYKDELNATTIQKINKNIKLALQIKDYPI